MSKLQASLYLFFAYSICAILLCGDLTAPLADVLIIAPSGSGSFWHLFLVGSLVAAAILASARVTPFV